MSFVDVPLGELRELYNSLKPVMLYEGEVARWDPSRWNPELCRYGKRGMIGLNCFDAVSETFLEGTPHQKWICCKGCRDVVPALLTLQEMIKYCEKWNDDHYTLAKSSPYFKILKPHLPKETVDTVCMTWYTFVPHDRLGVDGITLGKMAQFCKELFENPKRIAWSMWVIESGKHASKPNPHIHALVKYHPNGSKNYMSRERDKLWTNHFPKYEHRLDWRRDDEHKGIEYRNLNCQKLQQQKIDYMDNDKKHTFGESHTNYIDLGIRGGLSS